MSKILAIFGATGQQGGSVIRFVLNDPELSQKYKIRAITRDINSEKVKELKEKVEVVQGDALDQASLETALSGVHTVFAMTQRSFGADGFDIEYQSGKRIADAAVSNNAKYIIFTTLPPVTEISGGKYTKVTPFDAKAKAEQYIRGLPIKSAFYSPGVFMQNFQTPMGAPRQDPTGTWVMARHTSPKTLLPLIDAVEGTGQIVGAILAEPDKYEGKTFCAAAALYSLEEIAAIIQREQKSHPFETDVFVETFSYHEEFGYFGPDSENLVAWAASNARGKLSTLEEYLEAHPLQLE